jgi:nanoRNase/pAp phosphatase (c-di-AMP/oligoRNAs hydrolase)
MAPEEKKKYRLVTRSDMDGLVSAILLKQLDMISEIVFVHPKDVQDGKIAIDDNCITTNLPYVESAHLAFDHHTSEVQRIGETLHDKPNLVLDPKAPSTAHTIFQYYGGKSAFPNVSDEMLMAVDKADSAAYTAADVLYPKGWELLSFLMDARTGLGRFRNFRLSNYDLMMKLIDYCRTHTIDEILELPDVKERVDLYFAHQISFKDQIRRCSTLHNNVAVLDLRNEEIIYAGNRFMIYAIHPRCNISVHILWGRNKQNIVYAVGKSIFNRTSKANVGKLMAEYGGGGHEGAGTCQVSESEAEKVKQELIDKLQD